MKALLMISVLGFSLFSSAQERTEGQFLDPSCNCVREPSKNAPLDADLVRKMGEEARAGAGKKLLAQVKSYRCPRAPKKEKDDVNLSAYGIRDDDEEGPELSEVMDTLIAKAGIDESHLEGDVRSRAEDSLEKKIEKCRKDRTKNVANRRNDPTSNSSAMNLQMTQMMMALQMQPQMSSGMNYGMNNGMMNGMMNGMNYGMNSMMGYNPYQEMSYNPYAMLARTSGQSLASLSPAQQVALRSYGAGFYVTPSLSTMTPAQQVMSGQSTLGNFTWPFPNSAYSLRPLSSR